MFSYQDTKKNPNVLSLWFALRFVLKTSVQGKFLWTRRVLGISKTVTCLLGMQKLISETTQFLN